MPPAFRLRFRGRWFRRWEELAGLFGFRSKQDATQFRTALLVLEQRFARPQQQLLQRRDPRKILRHDRGLRPLQKGLLRLLRLDQGLDLCEQTHARRRWRKSFRNG